MCNCDPPMIKGLSCPVCREEFGGGNPSRNFLSNCGLETLTSHSKDWVRSSFNILVYHRYSLTTLKISIISIISRQINFNTLSLTIVKDFCSMD